MTGDDAGRAAIERTLDYESASLPVRSDLVAAHRRAWRRLASPGAWWSGSERVAIAHQVRCAAQCALCAERAAALSPNAVAAAHEPAPPLSSAAVEAVHRITRDPGRLSRAWRDGLRAAGLDDGAYVELIGVVVTVAGGRARAYPAVELVRAGGGVEESLEGRRVRVAYDSERETFSVDVPSDVEIVEDYWFAWMAFHPASTVFVAGRERAPDESPSASDEAGDVH